MRNTVNSCREISGKAWDVIAHYERAHGRDFRAINSYSLEPSGSLRLESENKALLQEVLAGIRAADPEHAAEYERCTLRIPTWGCTEFPERVLLQGFVIPSGKRPFAELVKELRRIDSSIVSEMLRKAYSMSSLIAAVRQQFMPYSWQGDQEELDRLAEQAARELMRTCTGHGQTTDINPELLDSFEKDRREQFARPMYRA